jgi:hypothetical protein
MNPIPPLYVIRLRATDNTSTACHKEMVRRGINCDFLNLN